VRDSLVRWFSLLVAAAVIGAGSAAQSQERQDTIQSKEGPSKKDDPKSASKLYVAALAKRFEQFRDPVIAVRGITLLGSAICQYDPVQAQGYFEKAAQLVRSLRDKVEAGSSDLKFQYERNRRYVVQEASRCNPQFLARLDLVGKDENAPAVAAMALDSAYAALKDHPETAAQLLKPISGQWSALDLNSGVRIAQFLLQLRAQAPSDADRLFLSYLQEMSLSGPVDPMVVIAMGNYLFGHQPTEFRNLKFHTSWALALLAVCRHPR
jgi:hypothetical protein